MFRRAGRTQEENSSGKRLPQILAVFLQCCFGKELVAQASCASGRKDVMSTYNSELAKLRKKFGRAKARLTDRIGQGTKARDLHVGPSASEVESLKAEARELWARGDRDQALDVYRVLASTTSPSSGRWLLYAQKLLERGRGQEAFLALSASLDLNPANFQALELYEDSVFHLDKDPSVLEQRLQSLAEACEGDTRLHWPAFDFFAGNRFQPGMDVLRAATEDRIRALMEASPQEKEEVLRPPSDHVDVLVTEMKRLLARSNSVDVAAIAENVDASELPVNELRLAIRRALRTGKYRRAQRLLAVYQRALPDDGWGSTKVQEVKKAISPVSGVLSPYQLRKRGFPIPAMRSDPAYEAVKSRSLYALHNALPHSSAGYATRTQGLLSGLRSHGWDVRGVTRFGYPYDMPGGDDFAELPRMEYVDGVPYYHLSTAPEIPPKKPLQQYVAGYSDRLRSLALECKPFVIHAASNHWNGLAAVVAARELGVPSVYEVRGLWEVTRGSRNPSWAEGGMYKFISAMERDAAQAADKVIAITQGLADELIERGVDPDKIVLVPNGVNSDRFSVIPKDAELAETLGVSGKTVIGYVGSLLDYEGIDLLLQAAQKLKAERSDFAVLLVGDGAEREQLEADAHERGLDDIVIFTGRVPHEQVESYYSLVDITPFPRRALPVCEMVSPLKPLEAMAMGKAVIASNVQALSEMVEDGVTGILHTKDDVTSLTDGIRDLLDDKGLRDRLGKKGREWVEQARNWAALTSIISNVYQELGGVPLDPESIARMQAEEALFTEAGL